MNPKVDFYFEQNKRWEKEIGLLRKIILNCGLTEELKWGCPCYTWKGTNIVLIHVFKEYCALLFFKGALLKDPDKILVQQTKQVQAARQIRFTHATEINKLAKTLKSYIYQAIEVERAGLKVKLKKTSQYSVPKEFQQKLDKNARLKKAFDALTPGRQRGYLLFFSAPKQSETRTSRVEKYKSHILAGKGLNDQ